MNKEKLQEIASTMTEEEFKSKYIVINYGGEEILNIDGEEFVCPNVIGLRNILSNPTGCCRDCKECWENAIKELKFKEDNMKELNIIEASKMPNTEFEVIYPSGNKKFKHIKTNEVGTLLDCNNKEYTNACYHDIIQAKFIPLPKEKEVDFMEALKAYGEGKTIICKIGNNKTEFKPQALFTNDNPILDEFEDGITAKEILEGKWYIIND